MNTFDPSRLKKLYVPLPDSHKGQNGKLLLIGGSKLFHAASLWSLKVASRIVDMVFYASVPENNEIVQKHKEEFRDGIVIPREKIDDYIQEADCILIGPGLPRKEGIEEGDDDTKTLTEKYLRTYPKKQWVIDGGSLQEIDPEIIPEHAIITPHQKEFEKLFGNVIASPEAKFGINSAKQSQDLPAGEAGISTSASGETRDDTVSEMVKKYRCIILLKGEIDIICSRSECVKVEGGNAGMTKGGTGDVLAGLVAALACKNDPFLAAAAGSCINKKAGESLSKRVGFNFNASDLCDEIPKVMKEFLEQYQR